MMEIVNNTEFAHYGVLGMKWGVRHDRKKAYDKAIKKLKKLDSKGKKKKAMKWAKRINKEFSNESKYSNKKVTNKYRIKQPNFNNNFEISRNNNNKNENKKINAQDLNRNRNNNSKIKTVFKKAMYDVASYTLTEAGKKFAMYGVKQLTKRTLGDRKAKEIFGTFNNKKSK